MQIIHILVQSNHNIHILKFIERLDKKSRNLLKIVRNVFPKKKAQQFFSILTSPHVNKRAQEQFKIKRYKVQLSIKTSEPLKMALLLKRISSGLFPNISLQISASSNTVYKKRSFGYPKKLITKITTAVNRKKGLLKVHDISGILITIV